MANNNEIVLDTYVPEIFGFVNDIPDKDNEPLRMRTFAGALYISGRKVTIPTQIYTYAPNSDNYEDLILNLNTNLIGDGVKSSFTLILQGNIKPILYSTVKVTDGSQLLTDISTDMLGTEAPLSTDSYIGTGVFRGDGVGSINYTTGELTITFSSPPISGAPIEVSWITINRIPAVSGSTPPNRTLNSTRLQVVKTNDTGIASTEILAKTDWDRPVFISGRVFQSREANEIVSILTEKIRSIGNSIFNDGDFVAGSQLSVSDEYLNTSGETEREVQISKGLYYIQGCVRSVPGATLRITGRGNETIGIRVVRSVITEDLNKDLKDISTGWDGSGLPGAYREHVEIQWKANDPSATTVFDFVNGSALNVPVVTKYSRINDVIAHRTYLESGNYKVSGFKPSFTTVKYNNTSSNSTETIGIGELEDDLALWLNFDSGTAFVEGYEVFKPQSSKIRWRKSRDPRLKQGVIFTYKPSGDSQREIYALENTPVASVKNIKAYARTPLMYVDVTYANIVDGHDLPALSSVTDNSVNGEKFTGISPSPDISNVKIFDSEASDDTQDSDYTQGSDNTGGDFYVDQNKVIWNSGGASPVGNYYAIWSYDTSAGDFPLIKGTRILKKEHLTLTMDKDDFDPVKRMRVLLQDGNGNTLRDLAKYFRVFTDGSGSPPNTEFTFGTDYRIKLGRTQTSTDVDAKLIWKRNGRRPGNNDEDTVYYVDVYRWTHDIALHDAPTWLSNQSPEGCAEGDYLSADSYLEELPDLPSTYNGSQLQFPNAPSGAPYNSKIYRILYHVPGYRNSSIKGERDTKNRNSIDFRPLGVLLGDSANPIRRSLSPNTEVTCDYYYFQPRLDTVRLKKSGEFQVVYGESGSQSYPIVQSERTLPLIQIYSKANTRYPRVTDNSVYRSTMQDIQILKDRVNRLEVDFITSALEQDAISSAGGQLLRGVYTDAFKNFDFFDLDYQKFFSNNDSVPVWEIAKKYFFNDVVKVESISEVYFRCIRSGTSLSSTPLWTEIPGSVIDEDIGSTAAPLWKAFGYNQYPKEYENDREYVTDTPVVCDSAINNLAGSLKFPSHIESIRDGVKWPADYDTTWYSGTAKSRQLIMLPWEPLRKNTQLKSNYTIQINSKDTLSTQPTFDPPMCITLDPPADYDIDISNIPIINTTFPGSSVANRSGQYGDDGGSASDIGDNDGPVHPIPRLNPYGRIDGWVGEFHFGIPTDTVSINSSIAPGMQAALDKDGTAIHGLGYGVPPDMLGLGFLPEFSQVTSSTNFENIGNIVVSNALTRYIKEKTISVFGRGFPYAADVSVYFDGNQIEWILDDGSKAQTIKTSSNTVSRGDVFGKIKVPADTPTGKHEVTLKTVRYSASATYVAQGHMEQSSTNWSSIVTVVNDLRSDVTPLAQIFTSKNDSYLAGVSLYFSNVDSSVGMEIQIREVVNGYPGKTVLGTAFRRLGAEESDAVKFHSVNSKIPADFYFNDPVFLDENTEYCICVMTNSSNYGIWAAMLGSYSIEDGTIITRGYDVGQFVVSFNGTTWETPTSEVILKFDLIYCKFTKSSVSVNFPKIESMTGGAFILGATSLVPTGGRIQWSASVDGTSYFPVRPNLLVNIEKIWRGLRLKADIYAANDRNGSLISPCINYQHMGVFSNTLIGKWFGYKNANREVVETNYIGENVSLDYSIEQLKVFTEEYFSENQKVEIYFSPDDGDTWILFANAANEIDQSVTSYAASPMGGSSNMYDVARSYTLREITLPPTPSPIGDANEGLLTSGTQYFFKYTFTNDLGESLPSVEQNKTLASGMNSITFSIPTDNVYFPEYSSYNSNKPVKVTGINIYLGTATGDTNLKRLSDSSYDVTEVSDILNVVIKDDTYFEDDEEVSLPTVNTTQPTQFKLRIKMISPINKVGDSLTHLVSKPTVEFGGVGMVVSVEPDTGNTAAESYYIRYSWTSEFGETEPSPEPATPLSVTSSDSSIYFKFSETTDNINTPSKTFPAGAKGARLYSSIESFPADSWEYGLIKVQVKREGQLIEVEEILTTDEYVSNEGFRIVNALWDVDSEGETTTKIAKPSQYNSTGGLINSSPQVSKLRVIAVDEL